MVLSTNCCLGGGSVATEPPQQSPRIKKEIKKPEATTTARAKGETYSNALAMQSPQQSKRNKSAKQASIAERAVASEHNKQQTGKRNELKREHSVILLLYFTV